MLPNFIVVGAAKSATTSLYQYLKEHPEIYMSPLKEPYFFSFMNEIPNLRGPHDTEFEKQIVTKWEAYEKLFQGVKNEKVIGECSTSYLYFSEKSSNNIKRFIPDCKIIIILRNPIERAFSHYNQRVKIGHESSNFREALEQEKERIQLGWRWNYDYTGGSMYYKQVKCYLQNFPKENIRIYLFEEFVNNTKDTLRDIFYFLGVKSDFQGRTEKIHNITAQPIFKFLKDMEINEHNKARRVLRRILPDRIRKRLIKLTLRKNVVKVDMSTNDREYLNNLFHDEILRLGKLINRDLSAWVLI
jgi:hypothetical protein